MISCYEVKSYLTQLQDEEMDEEFRLKVNDHLGRCALCLKEAQELELTWDLLDEYEGLAPSPDFKAKFWRKAQELEQPRPFFTRWAVLLSNRSWKLAAVGACMMALLAIGYGILPSHSNDLDKFDNQLLQEVNRLVNTDFDEPLAPLDEGRTPRPEKPERHNSKNLNKTRS